jgi:nicotinate phosphoribosyltransferase
MLDDTYGSDCFRRFLSRKYAEDFRGFRQDSGDPFEYGEKTIRYYEGLGINPKEKMIVFSDGLTPERAVEIHNRFVGRIISVFGIGTNLTNDLGFIKPLSLVMKIVSAAGNPAVKLSNNLDKATGDPREIEEIKRIFGYTNEYREAVVY